MQTPPCRPSRVLAQPLERQFVRTNVRSVKAIGPVDFLRSHCRSLQFWICLCFGNYFGFRHQGVNIGNGHVVCVPVQQYNRALHLWQHGLQHNYSGSTNCNDQLPFRFSSKWLPGHSITDDQYRGRWRAYSHRRCFEGPYRILRCHVDWCCRLFHDNVIDLANF